MNKSSLFQKGLYVLFAAAIGAATITFITPNLLAGALAGGIAGILYFKINP